MPTGAAQGPLSFMPDAAVAEPTTLVDIAEPVEEAPPTPAVEPTEPEGDAVPDAEGDAPQGTEIPEGLDREATEAWLHEQREKIRAEERAAADADAEQRAEQRLTQRQREMDEGKAARHAAFKTVGDTGSTSAQALIAAHENGETLHPRDLETRMNDVIAAAQITVYRDLEDRLVQKAETKYLPDITEPEKKALDDSRYALVRNGDTETHVFKVTELALARKDAEIADLKKRLNDRTEMRSDALKLAKAAEAAGPGVGAETPAGKAPGTGKLTLEEADNLPIDELKRRGYGA